MQKSDRAMQNREIKGFIKTVYMYKKDLVKLSI